MPRQKMQIRGTDNTFKGGISVKNVFSVSVNGGLLFKEKNLFPGESKYFHLKKPFKNELGAEESNQKVA